MAKEQRPDIWIGHVSIRTAKLGESETFMKEIGLRPIFRNDDVAVLELRGGTHIVLIRDEDTEPGEAKFDFMVEDIDVAFAELQQLGVVASEMTRGEIHDSFQITEPGGSLITVNSTHVSDHSVV